MNRAFTKIFYSSLIKKGNSGLKKALLYLLMTISLYTMAHAESEKTLFDKGVSFLKQEKYSQAIEAFTQLIEIVPDNPDAYKNRGVAHMKMSQYDEAIKDFEKTREIKPDLKGLYSNLGVAWYYKGDYTQAINNYNMEIALTPDNHYAYFNRAICRAEIGEFAKSLEDVDKSLELFPDFYLALCLKGDLLVKLDQPLKAKQAYKDAIGFDSGQDYAKERLASLSFDPPPRVGEDPAGPALEQKQATGSEKGGDTLVVEKKVEHRSEKKPEKKVVEKPEEKPASTPTGLSTGLSTGSPGEYQLQAGAYQVYKNAQDMKNRLSDKGYQIRIIELTRPSGIKWFLVRIGAYATRQAAETTREEAKAALGVDIIIRPFNQF